MKNRAILFLLFAGSLATAFAQAPAVVLSDKAGWHKIAETTVNFKQERDEVFVVGKDHFAKLKFKVVDAPIMVSSVEIFYESGDSQKVKVDFAIEAAGESGSVDLEGGERKIKSLSFVYKTLPNRADNQAHVEIYGLKI